MQILENIIKQYDFNLSYAQALVEDVSVDQMTTKPAAGLENHPAFTLGHLVSGSALLVEDLGGKFQMADDWKELFLRKGPGDPRYPVVESERYPSKAALLKELEYQHDAVKTLLRAIEPSKLDDQVKWRFGEQMPSLLDIIIFMCINHEAMHLGQLAGWRRAMGLHSALASL